METLKSSRNGFGFVNFTGKFKEFIAELSKRNVRIPRRVSLSGVSIDERLFDYLYDFCNMNDITPDYFVECLIYSYFQGLIPDAQFLPPQQLVGEISHQQVALQIESETDRG